MAKGKEVVVAKKHEVVDWRSSLKASAQKQAKAAEALTTGSVMVSFKGATLSIGGMQRRNNEAEVIVLAVMNERAYYEGKYNPEEPRSPACYAYGEVDGAMPIAPHKEAPEPQHDTCKGCPHAEWGSADVGRGQACRQSVKLALVAMPEKGEMKAPELAQAEINFARIPPTSLKAVKVYLDWLGAQDSATYAWRTKLEVRPSSKSIFTVHLTPEGEVPADWHGAILARVKDAAKAIEQPYPTFDEAAANQAKAPAPKGKRRF